MGRPEIVAIVVDVSKVVFAAIVKPIERVESTERRSVLPLVKACPTTQNTHTHTYILY